MDFKLSTQNIGPLRNFSSSNEIGRCEIGIFANNGRGKTFLSRMFQLVASNEYEVEKLNNPLTINKNQGRLHFELKNPLENGHIRSLDIDLKRDADAPVINNTTGYFFHVFNSDYVRENIERREYACDKEIGGYIVGKGNIDLSEEKKGAGSS